MSADDRPAAEPELRPASWPVRRLRWRGHWPGADPNTGLFGFGHLSMRSVARRAKRHVEGRHLRRFRRRYLNEFHRRRLLHFRDRGTSQCLANDGNKRGGSGLGCDVGLAISISPGAGFGGSRDTGFGTGGLGTSGVFGRGVIPGTRDGLSRDNSGGSFGNSGSGTVDERGSSCAGGRGVSVIPGRGIWRASQFGNAQRGSQPRDWGHRLWSRRQYQIHD